MQNCEGVYFCIGVYLYVSSGKNAILVIPSFITASTKTIE